MIDKKTNKKGISSEKYIPKGIVIEDIVLTNCDGTSSKDLRYVTLEMNIYEDIWQTQIMGDITIRDDNEWIQTFPIIGEETIDIKFHVPTKNSSIKLKKFRVYKVGNRSSSGATLGRAQVYTLYFMSSEIMTNFNTMVSRSFNSVSASHIVDTIYKEYLNSPKPIDIEPTEGNLKVVFPSWTPLRIICWLASNRAINKATNADFVFFEAIDKEVGPKYYFKSIQTLLSQEPTFTLKFDIQNKSDSATGPNKGMKDISSQNQNVNQFSFDKHGNSLKNNMKGLYDQTWIFFDPLRKKFVVSKYNHDEDFVQKQENKTSKFYTETTKKESKPLSFLRMPGGVNSFPTDISPSKALNNDPTKAHESAPLRKMVKYIADRETTDELETTSLIPDHGYKRVFKFQQMNNFRLTINDFPGTDDIQCGKTVNFEKPHISSDPERFGNKAGTFKDKYVSGNYLVTRLRHRITFHVTKRDFFYTQYIELVKDDFETDIKPFENKITQGQVGGLPI